MQSHIKISFRFKCIVGILPKERCKKQPLCIKLEARADEFLDYAKILAFVKKSYKEKEFELLEQSLEFLSLELKKTYPSLKKLKIYASKSKIIKKARVGVMMKKKFKD